MAHPSQGPPTRAQRTLFPPFGRERYRPPRRQHLAISQQRGAEMRAKTESEFRRVELEARSQQRADDLLDQLGNAVATFVSATWSPATGATDTHGSNRAWQPPTPPIGSCPI
jgi:hypothetical protein